ncbi:hypothetical protein HWI79_251 [Cryptosporidium felis]|nr:hypothetical protein HWI79_251 [Cryptosporidium felis]
MSCSRLELEFLLPSVALLDSLVPVFLLVSLSAFPAAGRDEMMLVDPLNLIISLKDEGSRSKVEEGILNEPEADSSLGLCSDSASDPDPGSCPGSCPDSCPGSCTGSCPCPEPEPESESESVMLSSNLLVADKSKDCSSSISWTPSSSSKDPSCSCSSSIGSSLFTPSYSSRSKSSPLSCSCASSTMSPLSAMSTTSPSSMLSSEPSMTVENKLMSPASTGTMLKTESLRMLVTWDTSSKGVKLTVLPPPPSAKSLSRWLFLLISPIFLIKVETFKLLPLSSEEEAEDAKPPRPVFALFEIDP